ncbi:hypothetical protein [Arthrobacter sp. A5]|uniref:hypothetical protein n=1 Tax=Arthrobacter sp. A5 TaxID=576926 RepID=UPI003DA7A9FD
MRSGLYLGGTSLPFVSSLRIFSPMKSFTTLEQRYIEEHLLPDQSRSSVDVQELADSLGRVTRGNGDPLPTAAADRIRTLQLVEDGPLLYSPGQMVIRSSEAVSEFHRGHTAQLANLLVPERFWEPHQRRTEESPGHQGPHFTRISTWGIPFSWFVLVTEADRTEVVESGGHILTVRIQVPLSIGIKRAEACIAMLEETAAELDLYDELDSVNHWLNDFHAESVLELDYGPVADRVYPDDSPMDVRLGLECLAEGDLTGAAAAYRRLATRWIPIRQRARAS